MYPSAFLRVLCAALPLGLAGFTAVPLSAAEPGPLLASLKPGHPRILATAADFQSLKKLASAGRGAEWFQHLQRDADKLLKASPSTYEIPDGKRLLATSRRVLDRALTLGIVFRLTGDRRYAGRLWQELETAAKFKDWNPSHFLDTAEMTAAFAIGYDWLHDFCTAEQKLTLRTAIVDKGLRQALPLYRGRKWWTQVEHNWNQVCNGGMVMGALAVAEEEPELSGEILAAAVASVPKAMKEFAPDGAWGEGPGYWDYAVMYNVFMLAAMDTALGSDAGLSQIEGFAKAADFPIHVTGPLGRTFNYADAGDRGAGGPHIIWLATKFNRPDHAAWRLDRAGSRPDALDFLYGARWLDQKPGSNAAPLAKYFRGPEVVALRSAWNDPQATFAGFKAGDNKVNHGHLDLGSFVLDAAGERWALDSGGDDYNLPGYFGKKRWDYYRLRAEGHNTLVLSPDASPDQSPDAVAKIIRFSDKPGAAFAVADLSPAYQSRAQSVQRGVRLAGRSLLVQDEIARAGAGDVYWFMHTGAEVKCDGATAVLTQNGKTLTASLLSPPGAVFSVMPAEPLPSSPQPARQQVKKMAVKEVKKLTVHCRDATALRITVLLTPEASAPAKSAPVPLKDWK